MAGAVVGTCPAKRSAAIATIEAGIADAFFAVATSVPSAVVGTRAVDEGARIASEAAVTQAMAFVGAVTMT